MLKVFIRYCLIRRADEAQEGWNKSFWPWMNKRIHNTIHKRKAGCMKNFLLGRLISFLSFETFVKSIQFFLKKAQQQKLLTLSNQMNKSIYLVYLWHQSCKWKQGVAYQCSVLFCLVYWFSVELSRKVTKQLFYLTPNVAF